MTYGKTSGLGLGLCHAKNTIESWGGKLKIESQVHHGTLVEIHLPKAQIPSWFMPKINLIEHQYVVIIDDDKSIHDVWKERFRQFEISTNKKVELLHFYSPKEFMAWNKIEAQSNIRIMYLFDYEFIGSDVNGIDLIIKFNVNYLSILVTSRFDSEHIITRCEELGIKFLPKNMASFIPLGS